MPAKLSSEEWIRNVFANVAYASNGCAIWQRSRLGPYASIRYKGKITRGHRAVYQYFKGTIPSTVHVLHSCDNPLCLNIKHLRAGTHQENMDDKMLRRRHTVKNRTHCKRGHEFSGYNLILRNDGARSCRKCKRISDTNRRSK